MASLGITVASNVDRLDENLIQRKAKINLLWEQKSFYARSF